MPISLTNNFSYILSRAVQNIKNPNNNTGVLIEEIPSDIGRTIQSYKRGGFLEGAERFRRETLSAAVWLFGIPCFNWLGNKFFENCLHLPMNMDYEDETIKATVNFLKTGKNPKNLDVSELSRYMSSKIKDGSVEDVAKSVKRCKGISIVAATILNCAMMGFVIPRFNQYLTKKKIAKLNQKKVNQKQQSFDKTDDKTSNNQPSFTGNILKTVSNFVINFPFYAENNSTVRLISTDVPTLIGRASTSRNKYEALENTIIDGGSIFFYNFCAGLVQKLIRNCMKIPNLNPIVAHKLAVADPNLIKDAMDKVANSDSMSVAEIFQKDNAFADDIYKMSTFGKYGKINRYVPDEQVKGIDSEVYKYIKILSDKIGYGKGRPFDMEHFNRLAKRYNAKNSIALAAGFIMAIYGLSTFLPKVAFKITTLLTGKDEFTGIAHFDDKNKKVKKS